MSQKKLVPEGVEFAITTATGLLVGPGSALAVRATGKAIQWHRERFNRRAQEFVDEFMESGYPDETARIELAALLENPTVPLKDVVLDAVRQLDDLVSDEVIPALAMLTREYVRSGRPKDRFFNSIVRVLRDMEAGELAHLRKIIAAVVDAKVTRESGSVYFARIGVRGEGQETMVVASRIQLPWEESYGALMGVFIANGLATLTVGLAGYDNETESWMTRAEPWLRLAEVLGVTRG